MSKASDRIEESQKKIELLLTEIDKLQVNINHNIELMQKSIDKAKK